MVSKKTYKQILEIEDAEHLKRNENISALGLAILMGMKRIME